MSEYTQTKPFGTTFDRRELSALIHPLRFTDNYTNLFYIAGEYLTLAAVVIPTIAFLQTRADWDIHWMWTIPVTILAVLAIGGVQHRLAGLGHEGPHYILLRNRFWNEVISDWFCMFPLYSTTHQYRPIHLGHHEYTNDWEHDPTLLNLGKIRMMDKFPMTKWKFIYLFYIRLVWPIALLRYIWGNIYATTLGSGMHSPDKCTADKQQGLVGGRLRWTTVLGVLHFAAFCGVMGYFSYHGTTTKIIVTPVVFAAVAAIAIGVIPENWFFQCHLKPVLSVKTTSMMRICWLMCLESSLAGAEFVTGIEWAGYLCLLWVLPLLTTFPYYMLLRDLYQHANADAGKLTNSRVILCNPLLRWAMFIYGQDVHQTHHLYPTVPHYNLMRLHRLLQDHNDEYRNQVVECDGMFFNRSGKPTMLDVIEKPTFEPDAPSTDEDHGLLAGSNAPNDGGLTPAGSSFTWRSTAQHDAQPYRQRGFWQRSPQANGQRT